MRNLRFFDFYWPSPRNLLCPYCYNFSPEEYNFVCGSCPYCSLTLIDENKVHALQGLKFSSSYIRFFRWFRYPLDSLPSNLEFENLVVLIMPGSKIKQLWDGVQHLEKLKHINLMYSKHLIRIPDLSKIPNLKRLILEGCTSLIEVHPSIQYLNKLVLLNLSNCKSLGSLPTNIQSKCLTHLILSGCSNLNKTPKITYSMERVYLDGTSITELSLIECSSRLKCLDLKDCSRLESLPSDICELKTLEYLNFMGCSNLHRFPENFCRLLDEGCIIEGYILTPNAKQTSAYGEEEPRLEHLS